MTPLDTAIKNVFDFHLSLIGLIFFMPVIFFAWLIASYDTKSNGFFIQERVGKNGKLFKLYKIKTMKKIIGFDTFITQKDDPRITKSGRFFRETKIDELPQLFNVFMGQMSFVGPRPDIPGFADKLTGKEKKILSIRPGITGPASIKYKNEETLLMNNKDAEKYNKEVIWPDKVKINLDYIDNWTLKKDLIYIFKTLI